MLNPPCCPTGLLDIDRLHKLSRSGDAEAALALWSEARRRDDPALATDAAIALDDRDKLIALTVHCWHTQRDALCQRAAHALGLRLERKTRDALDALLERANGRRRLRRLTRRDLLNAASQARIAPERLDFRHSSDGIRSARAAICLAVRLDDGDVVLGAASAHATHPNPAHAWRTLQPWQDPVAYNLARCIAWATGRGQRVRISPCARHDEDTPRQPPPRPRKHRADNKHQQLRTALQAPPSPQTFRKILKLTIDLAEQAPFATVEDTLQAWPPDTRVATWSTARQLLAQPELPAWRLLRTLKLHHRDFPRDFLAHLAQSPALQSIEHVTLDSLHPEETTLLLTSEALSGLAHLELQAIALRPHHIERLVEHHVPQRLRSLTLQGVLPPQRNIDASARAMAQLIGDCVHLTHLTLSRNTFGHHLHPALTHLQHLTHLHADRNNVPRDHLTHLIQSLHNSRLTHLTFSWNASLRDLAAMALTDAYHLTSLRHLTLSRLHMSQRAAQSLAHNPILAGLHTLDLSDNRLGDEGLDPLVHSPHLAGLRTLLLGRNGITARGARLLSQTPHLRRLKDLDLASNPLGPEGIEALATSRALRSLEHLNLFETRGGARGREALIHAPALRALVTGITGVPDKRSWKQA